MVATSELRELDHAEWCLVWVPEGVEFFWTDHADVAALDFCGDGRVGRNGLECDGYGGGIDFTSYTGQFRAEGWSVKILDDRDAQGGGTLAGIFAVYDATETPLVSSISPREHLGAQGSLYNQHIGVEAIDVDGARARFPCIPGWRFGHEHIGENYETSEAPISTVSEKPIVFRGRRCALYRVFRDHVSFPAPSASGWRPWAEAEQIWTGTIRDAGSVDGRVWTLEIDGPESLLYRRVGTLTDSPQPPGWPVKVGTILSTQDGNDETRIGIMLRGLRPFFDNAHGGFDEKYYGRSIFTAAVTSGTTPDTMAQAIAAEIDTVQDDAVSGPDGAFTAAANLLVQEVAMTAAGDIGRLWIKVAKDAAFGSRVAVMELCLHEKVWKAIGYNPEEQKWAGAGSPDAETWIKFQKVDSFPIYTNDAPNITSTPAPDYWVAQIDTWALGSDPANQFDLADNQGNKRNYAPLYPGGMQVIPNALPPDGLLVTLVDGIAHHTGQLDRPIPSKSDDPNSPPTIGGTACDAQGLFLFWGPRRVVGLEDSAFESSDEAVVARVGRCCWPKAPLKYAQINGPPAKVLLKKWLPLSHYGIPSWPGGVGDWVGLYSPEKPEQQIRCVPLLRLGYNQDGHLDEPNVLLERLMLTTGYAEGWTAPENANPEPVMNFTANEPAGLAFRRDAEVADLGLRIPRHMVADPKKTRAVFEGLGDGSYLRHMLAVRPGFDLADVYKGLFTAYGLCWHFRNGRFGVFSYPDVLTHEDVEVVLTLSEKAGSLDGPGADRVQQELRAGAPIDEFVLEYDWNPHESKFNKTLRQRSNDKGARYRQGGNVITAKAHGIRNPGGWFERIAAIAAFWEKRHFYLRGFPVKGRRPGQDIWPGTVVRITEPGAVTQTGTYGAVGLIGIVTHVRHTGLQPGPGGKREHVVHCDIFVQADSAQGVRLTAPWAVGLAYDPTTSRIYVRDNAFGMTDPDHFDTKGFVEPAWSTYGGGMMKVKGLQWNGASTSETFTASVQSSHAETENSYLVVTNFFGTYYRDMDTLIIPADMDQQTAAWVQQLFGVVCDKNGKWGAGLANGFPWH